jgi:hypothetical protein
MVEVAMRVLPLAALLLLAACSKGGSAGSAGGGPPPPPPPGPKLMTGGWLVDHTSAVLGDVPLALLKVDRIYVGHERVEFIGPVFPLREGAGYGWDYKDLAFGGGTITKWESTVAYNRESDKHYAFVRWSFTGGSTDPKATQEQHFALTIGIDDQRDVAEARLGVVSRMADNTDRWGEVRFVTTRMKQ